MSTKNILTGVVVALALVLVVIVILVKTGVFEGGIQKTTQPETVVETSIIVVTGTDEYGAEFEYTMMSEYIKPKMSSKYTYAYRPKTTTTVPSTTEMPTYFVEETSFVQVTDTSGVAVTNENGEPVTEVVNHTVLMTGTTTEPTTESTTKYTPRTSYVEVTNRWGQVEKDENGNAKTEAVTIDPPVPTQGDIWSESAEPATTSRFNVPSATPQRNETLAQAIVDQINLDRYEKNNLAPLTVSSELKTDAEMSSISMAAPDLYGDQSVGGAYTFTTEHGGNTLYTQTVAPAIAEKAASGEITKIGVGVIEHDGKYYTTVIFG